MNNLFARSVFFVKDAERSLRFYTEALGFSLEWNHQEQGRAYVFEVSLLGFQLILNQTGLGTAERAGHGRVFIGLEDDQVAAFRQHIEEKGIQTTVISGALQHLSYAIWMRTNCSFGSRGANERACKR